jgi:hypothetical protein
LPSGSVRYSDGHQVDQAPTGAQLDETEALLPPLDRAPKHLAIEMQHALEVDDSQHEVIDFPDLDPRSVNRRPRRRTPHRHILPPDYV